jgi:hypothetical protein
MSTNINYQQIFEDEVDNVTKDLMNLSTSYAELPQEAQRLVEELVDLGYRRAMEDALDPEVLADTVELSGEMGTQLYNFANMLQSFLGEKQNNGAQN